MLPSIPSACKDNANFGPSEISYRRLCRFAALQLQAQINAGRAPAANSLPLIACA